MICYRDTTFCVSPGCTNECGRKLTEEVRAEARKWWKDFNIEGEPPIAVALFCDEKGDPKR